MKDEIKNTIEVLRSGGIILYPTDTVWGIGCDAINKTAIDRVYKLKERADSKSMIILVNDVSMIYSYVNEVPDTALQLIEVNDKPMTIVYPGAGNLPDNLINSDGTIGIRVTDDPFCRELIRRFGKPLVSTSANISGRPAPAGFRGIEKAICDGVDYIVLHRQNETAANKPSSIIRVGLKGEVEIIRK